MPGLLYLMAVLCPPLAVYWAGGGADAVRLNILLTILGWLPGMVHAFYILATHCTAAACS